MQALYVGGSDGVQLKTDHPCPEPQPGEAMVKVLRTGICNTDLEIMKGYMGFSGVIGHEFVGQVVSINSAAGSLINVGQKVVGEINLPCDTCNVCEQGGVARRNQCPNRTTLGIVNKDGTHAEYLTLPVMLLFPVPDNVTPTQAAFTEPLAAAFRIVEQITFKSTDRVCVIGDGKLGLLISRVLATQPHSKLVIFGKHQEKLNLAPGSDKVMVTDTTGDSYESQFDFCVEASGKPGGIMLAAAVTRPLGTVVLKTTCAADSSSFNTAPFVIKELQIIGSRCGNFPMALEALKTGAVKVDDLLVKEFPMSQAMDAIKLASTPGTLKVQLVMESNN